MELYAYDFVIKDFVIKKGVICATPCRLELFLIVPDKKIRPRQIMKPMSNDMGQHLEFTLIC